MLATSYAVSYTHLDVYKRQGKAGYTVGDDIVFALDVASSELVEGDSYALKTENRTLHASEMITWYEQLKSQFPIVSIEDGLGENDWANWKQLTEQLGSSTQLVGDDLLVTNVKLIERPIADKTGNAILIKPNPVPFPHLDAYKRQPPPWPLRVSPSLL